MWVLQLLETLGRMLVGRIKPITFAHTPPGAYQNYVYLVLTTAMLGLALLSGKDGIPPSPLTKGGQRGDPISQARADNNDELFQALADARRAG